MLQTKTLEDAKDLFQDVGLKFCMSAYRLNLGYSLDGWFSAIVRTTSCDKYRRRIVEIPVTYLRDKSGRYSAALSQDQVFYANNAHQQRVEEMMKLFVKALPPAEMALLSKTYLAHMSVSKMSQELGGTRFTFWKRRNAVLKKLRKGLGFQLSDLENPDIPMSVLKSRFHLLP